MRRQIDDWRPYSRQTSGALTTRQTDRIMKQALARSNSSLIFPGETRRPETSSMVRNQLERHLRGMDL